MCSLTQLTKLSKTNLKSKTNTELSSTKKTISKTLSLSSISVPDRPRKENEEEVVKKTAKVGRQGVCDAPIFNFKGFCISGEDISEKLKSFLPSSIPLLVTNWDKVVAPIIAKIPFNPTGCIGDFDGKQLSETVGAQNMNCDSFPLNKETYVSAVGFAFDNVPCGKPITINMCVIFDKCGTFGISMNSGMGVCIAAYTTGIGAIVSAVSDVLDYVQFGVSPSRKFEQAYKIFELKDGDMQIKEVVIKSHLYLGIGITMPQTKIVIKGKDLSEYITFSASAKLALDFGDKSKTQLTKIIDNAKKGNALGLLKALGGIARELSVAYTGTIEMELAELTSGIIPNLYLSEISLNYLITLGVDKITGNTGNSGLSAGFYVFFKPNIIKTMYDWVKALIENLAAPLLALGLSVPELPEDIDIDGIELGLSVTQGQIGIKFKNPIFYAHCIFVYSGNSKGGCDFTSKIGAIILKSIVNFVAAGKEWIISAGKKLLDTKTGKFFLKVAMDTKHFAINVKKEAEKHLKEAGRVLTIVTDEVGNNVKYAVKVVNVELDKAATAIGNTKAGKWGKTAAEDVKDWTKTAANDVNDWTKTAANDVKDWTTTAAEDIANTLCFWC